MIMLLEKQCAHCGNLFKRDNRCTWAHWERAKYCSRNCTGLAKSIRAIEMRPSIEKVFWPQVSKSDGCWLWTGLFDKDGYGLMPYARQLLRAPKVSLEIDGRPVPKGQYACHHCDNPPCVRPDHLYPGTPKQNSADAIARGRQNIGARAKLSEADVVAIRSATGTHAAIAARFGVTPSNVTMIRQRRTWSQIP